MLDFVPRLTVSPELQNHVSREFHSVAKSLGMLQLEVEVTRLKNHCLSDSL